MLGQGRRARLCLVSFSAIMLLLLSPTPLVTGLSEGEKPTAVSPSSEWVAPAADACTPSGDFVPKVEYGTWMSYRVNTASDNISSGDLVLVQWHSPMTYFANSISTHLTGLDWITASFDDSQWYGSTYGIGYDTNPTTNALALIDQTVPASTPSVYTRVPLSITPAQLVGRRVLIGFDYDDGVIAWLNGTELFRSPQMPAGNPSWDTLAALHESSNGTTPNYSPIHDVTATFKQAMQDTGNVLAIGVWNRDVATESTDMLLVPKLVLVGDWTAPGFDASGWSQGQYGVGYDTAAPPNATALLKTLVAPGAYSVLTRATFHVDHASDVTGLRLGADFDDGYVAWINGVAVNLASMPDGDPAWNTNAISHESSNAAAPNYGSLVDILPVARPYLRDGDNVLAIGVWNFNAPNSSDLVLVPYLDVRESPEICDGADNDCDGLIDEDATDPSAWYRDGDGDGYGDPGQTQQACAQPSGYVSDNTDCDDTDPAVHPGDLEVCDGKDNDCDGAIDDGTDQPTTCGVGACASIGVIACVSGVLQPDTCTPGTGTAETCNGLDDDCDGAVDDGTDQPTTCGVGACASIGVIACVSGVLQPDTCTPGTGTAETCNGVDDDCDGAIDDGTDRPTTCGVGACASIGVIACVSGVLQPDTCTPGTAVAETCNGLDDDCDGAIDDGTDQPTTCGVGACASTGVIACLNGTLQPDTCTPGTAVAETCNGLDDDCDGAIDENGAALCDDTDPCTAESCEGVAGCRYDPIPPGTGTCPGAPVTVTITPSRTMPTTGSQIGACVQIDMGTTGESLGSYGLRLSWNPTVLAYAGHTGGTIPFSTPSANTSNAALGELRFADAADDGVGAGGTVFVLCINFGVIGPAGSGTTLDIELTSLFSSGFTNLQPTAVAIDASINVKHGCIIGDVNGDGQVNSGDALLILSYEVGLPTVPQAVRAAIADGCGDASGDGLTDSTDANIVLSYEIGLPIDPSLPIGQENRTIDTCPVCTIGAPVRPAAAMAAPAVSTGDAVFASVTSSVSKPKRNAEFEILVALDSGTARVGSYGATLAWDPKLVEMVGVAGGRTPGFDAPVVNRSASAAGSLRFAGASPLGATGRVEVVRVTLRALRALPKVDDAFSLSFSSLGSPGPGFENLLPRVQVLSEGR